MAYDGWIEFAGREFINLSRTAQLSETLGIDTVWTEPASVQWIQDALGGVDYDTVSSAPWYDPGYPASGEFAGFVPLSFSGLDDSTLSSTTIEYITDGGNSNKPRNATLSMVASVAIVASTERGAVFGKRWLDRLLRGTTEQQMFCNGFDLRYFSYEDVDAEIVHRRNVKTTRGTSVTRKRNTDCSSTWLTTFTMTAHDPFEYSEQIPALHRLGVQPEYVGPALATNLIINPSAEGDSTAGWSTLSAGVTITSVLNPVPPGAAGVTGERVFQIADSGAVQAAGMQLTTDITVAGGETYFVSAWIRGPIGKTIRMRAVETAGASAGVNEDHVLATADWEPISLFITTSVDATAMDVRFTEPFDTEAITFWVDAVMVVESAVPIDYLDGNSLPTYDSDTDEWTVYQWNGAENASTSSKAVVDGVVGGPLLIDQGFVQMVEQSCPVWDYSPLFDPQFPALVPSPTAPDFYPDGWDIADDMVFNRYWARLNPVEPSGLVMVPVITLESLTEARMVRVSIWPGSSDFDDQCDPLFTAIVTYLPGALEFTIDGEQQVAYVWDGASPVVRRTDSLVYGTDATPVEWTAFNDHSGLLVTLDLFLDEDEVEQGEGDVEITVAFVAKSD